MISSGSATPRNLARVAGLINSLHLAVGPIARLFTRQVHSSPFVLGLFSPFLFLCLYRKSCASGLLIGTLRTDNEFVDNDEGNLWDLGQERRIRREN